MLTIDDYRSRGTKISWAVTGGFFLGALVTGSFSNYYYTRAIQLYNNEFPFDSSYIDQLDTDYRGLEISFVYNLD
jgi:hypothetical protein